jgi:hypothetical protein
VRFRLARALVLLVVGFLPALAAPPAGAGPAPPWFAAAPAARRDVARGAPFVTLVIVPLCDDALIDCGSRLAGRPADLEHNLYWGAAFGQKRFFGRKGSGWEKVDEEKSAGAVLERVVFRRRASGRAWPGAPDAVEQLAVFEAFDGRAIDRALARLFEVAAGGATLKLRDGGRERALRVHVVGWAGHDRLMDGVDPPRVARAAAPIPSFVMACSSEAYFGDPLRRLGSTPLLTTRTLMAPEGYVVDAIVTALGDGAPVAEVRSRAVDAYAR